MEGDEMIVYLSGPISAPTPDRVEANVRAAEAWVAPLVKAGFAYILPHASARCPGAFDIPHEKWMECDYELVAASGVVLRLPGESKGGDLEVAYAEKLGLPVVHAYQVSPVVLVNEQARVIAKLKEVAAAKRFAQAYGEEAV